MALKTRNFGHFSLIDTDWFQGYALEPPDLQALLAESSSIRVSLALRSEAEPREQCVPRQSPGTRNVTGGVSREVSNFSNKTLPSTIIKQRRFHPIVARNLSYRKYSWIGCFNVSRIVFRSTTLNFPSETPAPDSINTDLRTRPTQDRPNHS